VEFHLFGQVEVRAAGALVEIGRRRERGLLALLLIDVGTVVPAERLIDLLCADDLPPKPRKALQIHVSRLRKALADGGAADHGVELVGRADGYTLLADPASVDLHRFTGLVAEARRQAHAADRARLLRSALELRRGTVCADLTAERLREYLDSRLDETILGADELWAETELELGHHAELVVPLAELTARYPTRESLVAARMLALFRSGRPADALAAYHATAQTLAETLGVDPGPELRRLHAGILRQDPDLAATPRRKAPAQLPHDVVGFTGREPQVTELASLLTGETARPVTICAVDGAAGVGKSALAVHVAHRVADRFPDGQLYVDLHGFDPSRPPLPSSEALGRFLRALGIQPDQVPHDSAERAGLYRSTLAGRRMLVLLDNAATPEQVRPLLPGTAGCEVLITSRDRLDGLRTRDGALGFTLDVLTEQESLRLLAFTIGSSRVAAEPDAALELARLCDHLPLALRIAADHAAVRVGQPLSALVAELSANRLDLLSASGDGVRAALTWGYQALNPAAARVFRRLGLHAGTEFSVAAAAALTEVDQITPTLDRLTGLHLLERSGPARYRFHDLVRLFAAELAAADRLSTVERSLAWYLHSADAAGRLLLPARRRADLPAGAGLAFASREDALDWCETESANLVAAVRQAAELGFDAIAWQLPVALWDYLVLRRYRMDWLGMYELARTAARRACDSFGEAAVLTCLAHGYWESRQFPDALRAGQSALNMWRSLGDQWGEGMALHLIGGAYLGLGQVDKSIDHYRSALAIHDRATNHWGTGWTLTTLGSAYRALGRHHEALEVTHQALDVWHNLGDRHGEATTWNNLADTYRLLGHLPEATHAYNMALEAHRLTSNRGGEAWAHDGLGHTHHAAGNPTAAAHSWHRALTILDATHDPRAQEIRTLLTDP
jgi:DNA-binding SARP family transcriptional activator/tetratricopeptide (TPR) repeat protein